MATLAEVLAAADRADAAGDAPAAERLRAYAKTLEAAAPKYDPAQLQAAADRARAAGDDAAAARLMAAIPAATPATPTPSPYANTPAMQPENLPAAPPMGGSRTAAEIMTNPQKPVQQPESFGQTASALMSGPVSAMQAFGGGLAGGASPSRDYLANDPLTKGLPGPVLTGLGALGDVGGAGLSAIGAGLSGAIGLGTELVPGQTANSREQLGNELVGMSQFAVPELAGASSLASLGGAAAKGSAVADGLTREAAAVKQAFTPRPVAPKPGIAAPMAAPAAVAQTPEAVAALVKKASKPGMGSVKAQEQLAEAALLNPEAKAAADRLGIELPADVFSDSEMVKSAAGLTRSEVGKEPEALWRRAIKAARDKADEIMAAMDGSPDIASVSDAVKSSLQSTLDGLVKTSKGLYEAVDKAIPKPSVVNVTNIVKYLDGVIKDVGGVAGLKGSEARLYKLFKGSDRITFGRLFREKADIGRAIESGHGPYGDMNPGDLKRMYGAISEDYMAAVEAVGGTELRAKLREANQLYAKQKGLEKRIVTAFGSDLDGSIGAKLRSAITQGSKGDIAGLNRVLKVIPNDLKKQAVATAISSATRSARATEPGFGLSEFAKTFGGIKNNKPVHLQISQAIGPEATAMLDDLLTVARRVTSADSNVLRTGKANQVLANAMQAEGLIGRVLHSTGGQRVVQSGAAAVGATMGGPMGAMVAAPIAVALTAAKPEALALAGKLFASPAFLRLAEEAAKGRAAAATVQAVAKSSAFKSWAKAARVGNPDAILKDIAPVAPIAGQEAANSNLNPEYEALRGRY